MANDLAKKNDVIALIEKMKPEMAKVLPRHLTPERMARIALSTIRMNDTLVKCSPYSIAASIMHASSLGLEPDGILGTGYLIPRWNSRTNGYECQFQVGYRGLVELARRSGQVSTIGSYIVYENEPFNMEAGSNPHIEHKPLPPSKRGEWIGAYAVCKFKDGGVQSHWMWREEIEAIRDKNAAKNKNGEIVGPWRDNPESMILKTPLRTLAKLLPLSPEFQKAAIKDEYQEAGIKVDTESIFDGIEMPESEVVDPHAEKVNEKINAMKGGKHE